MRIFNHYSLLWGIGFMSMVACQQPAENTQENAVDSTQTENTISENSPWQEIGRITLAVDDYFGKQVYDQNKSNLSLSHEGKTYELKIKEVIREKVYKIDENTGFISVKMTTDAGDSLVVDHKVRWDAEMVQEDQTKGGFKVDELSLRMVNGKELYKWEAKGNFYEMKK